MTELRAIITGKVQGVGFRDYVESAANTLNLVGFVANLPDGLVEVVVQGEPDTLKEFVEYLHEGSPLSQVENVMVDWATALKVYDDFSVLK